MSDSLFGEFCVYGASSQLSRQLAMEERSESDLTFIDRRRFKGSPLPLFGAECGIHYEQVPVQVLDLRGGSSGAGKERRQCCRFG